MHTKLRWCNHLNGKAGLQGNGVRTAWQMRYERIKIDELDFAYGFKVFNTMLHSEHTWRLRKSGRSHFIARLANADAETEPEMDL